MRNCLYNKNYNNAKNNSCCQNNKNNSCCKQQVNNSNSNNINCVNNLNSGNIRNNCECNNEISDRNCVNKELMEQMKLDLQAHDFAIEDLALYLDTHPDDTRAICMHNQYAKKYRKLSDEYQKAYGPLSIMYPCNSWRWLEEPWPWQNTGYNSMMRNDRNCIQNNNTIECDLLNDENRESNNNDYDLKGGIN